ncbi:uncharacterized mitochondrial protein AtMg00810-like [Solanum tuberosum]|uniref:uncharacterized mitochondrial protein AtMg00810-like n=1 Tax=Solanum tuberosum TaxID=4113 RepID=UPI00073A4FA0|nr:PREDICTED: uncharacterized mitochondrial protein AtMg00810-like [Solanum tuberosum]
MHEELSALKSSGTWMLVPPQPHMNIIGFRWHPVLLRQFTRELQSHFAMKDPRALHYFLGLEVYCTKAGLFLSQRKYISDILHRTKMQDARPIHIPLSLKHNLHESTGSMVDAIEYRSIVGTLLYLTLIRPEISRAVNIFCASLCIARLKFTGLGGFPISQNPTTGVCVFLGSNYISWSSKKQNTVARSSIEAEYCLLASLAADLTWVTYILKDIGISLSHPPLLFTDNISSLHLTVNPVMHAHTKHAELDYHLLREKVVQGAMVTRFIPSLQQIVDIFTKLSLPKQQFHVLRSKLGVVQNPTTSLRGSDKQHEQN